MMRLSRTVSAVAIAFMLTLPGVRAADTPPAAPHSDSDTYRELDLFGEVFERVRADYVEAVTDKQLVEGAIKGMLTSLDPHSSYMDAKEYREMMVQARGEFGGLGMQVTMENGVVKVVSPIDDTPAAHAGIKPGDLILAIDGAPVSGMTLSRRGRAAARARSARRSS